MSKIKVIGTLLVVLTFCINIAEAQVKTSEIKSSESVSDIIFVDSSWSNILKIAKDQNKLIFVDAYATWCGPCRLLKSQTFKEKEVVDFFNKNFINVTMDMEKGEGEELGQKWNVEAYPTLIFIDYTGRIISKKIGFVKGNELIEIAKTTLLE